MNMPLRLSDLGVEEKDIAHMDWQAQIIQLTPAIMTQKRLKNYYCHIYKNRLRESVK